MEITNVTKIEFNGINVLTTNQLTEMYGAKSSKVLLKNFERNSTRYVEGVHYFLITGEALTSLRQSDEYKKEISAKTRSLYLWTEEGALLHAKSLGTDKAWEAYSKLVKLYFAVKSGLVPVDNESSAPSQLALMKNMVDTLIEQEKKQIELEQSISVVGNMAQHTQDLLESTRTIISTNHGADWRESTNNVVNSIAKKLGDFKGTRDMIYDELSRRGKCNLSLRLDNLKNRCKTNGWTQSSVNKLNILDVIEKDAKLREIYIALVKEFAISYGV